MKHPNIRPALKIEAAVISRMRCCQAFSLVEVTLALGIITFGMVALFGLLPVGLLSVKNATESAGATNAAVKFSNAIRMAETEDGIAYRAFVGENIVDYSVGGGTVEVPLFSLALGGAQTDVENEERLIAAITIIPPETQGLTGKAFISIAWPAKSSYEDGVWSNHEGSLTTGIQFLPQR